MSVQMPVAERSKARSTAARLLGLRFRFLPGAWMSVSCWVLCVVRYRSLCRADPSSRGAIQAMVCHCVWSVNLKNQSTLALMESSLRASLPFNCSCQQCPIAGYSSFSNPASSSFVLHLRGNMCVSCLQVTGKITAGGGGWNKFALLALAFIYVAANVWEKHELVWQNLFYFTVQMWIFCLTCGNLLVSEKRVWCL